MLILKGIHDLLHEEPAIEYAKLRGFTPEVLPTSGETGEQSLQTNDALTRIKAGGVTAIYGFSGGGYNAVHIWKRLPKSYRDQIIKIIVLGSPGVTREEFEGCPDVLIYNNPGVAHMDQPDQFLKDIG